MSAPVRSKDPQPNAEATTAERSGADSDEVLAFEQLGDVLVIRPLGGLDRVAIARTRQAVAESATAVIVDLDDCVLLDPGPLTNVEATGERETCIVSSRLSCRRLLARTGITAHFAVFQRREDAMQARILAAEGYGPGWAVPQ